MAQPIPFNRPFIIGPELHYIAQSVLGGHISGDGPFAKACQAALQDLLGAPHALLTTSGANALEIAAILSDVGDGNEVILPSFAGASTANAFLNRGASLVFVDIRGDTLNLDEKLVGEAVTEQTRAIVTRHYAGVACEMDSICASAQRVDAMVIEDAAEGFNAKYHGRSLGTIGDLGALSFHETKDVICGEGGALVTGNESLFERGEIVREKGTNRSQFFRGQVDKYTWVDVGSSHVPSDILAAFLFAQLESVQVIMDRRRRIFEYYQQSLEPLAERELLTLPHIPEGCQSNFHKFFVLTKDSTARDGLIKHLGTKGIHAVFHFTPLHSSPMGLRLGNSQGTLPVTENISQRVVRLPFFYELEDAQIESVVTEIRSFFSVSPAV